MLAATGIACSSEVASAEAGDCLEEIGLLVSEDDLDPVDCDEDHGAQVVGTFEHEGGDDFPGNAEIVEATSEECAELFEDFVGAPAEETSLVVNSIDPTEETWEEADDRESICIALDGDGGDLDQSVEGAADDFEREGPAPLEETEDEIGGAEDTSLEDFADLVESCEGGDMADCDQLYADTPIGSQAEAVALECGGEDPGGQNAGTCEDQFG